MGSLMVTIGPGALPIVQYHTLRLDQSADLRRSHPLDLVKDRQQDAESVVAEHGALRNPRARWRFSKADAQHRNAGHRRFKRTTMLTCSAS